MPVEMVDNHTGSLASNNERGWRQNISNGPQSKAFFDKKRTMTTFMHTK